MSGMWDVSIRSHLDTRAEIGNAKSKLTTLLSSGIGIGWSKYPMALSMIIERRLLNKTQATKKEGVISMVLKREPKKNQAATITTISASRPIPNLAAGGFISS